MLALHQLYLFILLCTVGRADCNLSYTNLHLTCPRWNLLLQTRLWGPRHSGTTVSFKLTYLLTYSMKPSSPWEANMSSAKQEIPQPFTEPEVSLPHSQVPAICPYPEPARPSPCPNIPLPQNVPFRALGRTTVSVQVRGSCKHFVTVYVFTARSC